MLKYPGKEIPGFHFKSLIQVTSLPLKSATSRWTDSTFWVIIQHFTCLHCIKSRRDEIFIFISTSMGLEDQLHLYIR